MTEKTDGQLLDEFVGRGNSAAFEQVVRRHMDWVYSCARRMLRDAHLAEDVAQAVFILLARKARALRGHAQLGGWLFRATRYCAANAIKQQVRRQYHEQEARIMQSQTAHDEAANWQEIYPILDEAVTGLGGSDRDALLLRFYQGKSMAEVGMAMGISEEAAKKRVQRAVEKLRGMMAKKGVTVGAGSLVTVMGVQVTQAAPPGLVEAALAASAGATKAAMAGTIANAAGKLMWWAKAKVAAMLMIGTIAGGAAYGIAAHALSSPPVPQKLATATIPPPVASAPAPQAAPSMVFDGLYEKAPGSGPELSMKVGPNTFAVTAVVRYDADGKPLATDGRGKTVDLTTLPLAGIQPTAGANRDVALVFLQPGRERYDIDRLRVFDHMTRRFISNVVVTQVPALSALRITAEPGTLPPQIDLWLVVASYDAANVPVSLPAKSGATVAVGGTLVGFNDIRDGRWDTYGAKFTNVSLDMPMTTLQLKATGKWNVGRYQISAVSKSGQKYMSDFFINLASGTGSTMFFPFALEQTDHFELRPLARQPPFFFDGIALPVVTQAPAAPGSFPQPVIVKADKESRVQLPCGAVVELAGIGYHPHTAQGWWGLDGPPVELGDVKVNGSVFDNDGRFKLREFAARLVDAPAGVSGLLWQFSPAISWAGGGSDRESSVAAALPGDAPVSVRVGVAATPWETLEEIAVEKLPAETQCWPGFIESPRATADGVSLTTAMMNLPGNVRMTLIDREGNARRHNASSSSNDQEKIAPWGYQSVRMRYAGLRLEDIRGIRFETRHEEYAAFENVPLQPK